MNDRTLRTILRRPNVRMIGKYDDMALDNNVFGYSYRIYTLRRRTWRGLGYSGDVQQPSGDLTLITDSIISSFVGSHFNIRLSLSQGQRGFITITRNLNLRMMMV